MSENEDKYHDTILDLEENLKKNVDLFLKIGNSLQAMFMLGPKPLSAYDQQLKHGLGYSNPYTLRQAISECPKLYVASRTGNIEIPLNVRDSEETLEDAFKNQVKLLLNELLDYFDGFQNLQIERQNDLLKDQLLEVSLKHDIELCVLLNHECADKSLHDELEQVKKKSLEIQEGLKARIKILEKAVQRCEKQITFFDNKKRDNAKMEYKKLFDSIKKTRSQTQKEMDELITHVSEKTYAYGAIRAENQNLLVTISELKARMKNGKNGMNATSVLRDTMRRDSHVKTSVLRCLLRMKQRKKQFLFRAKTNTPITFAMLWSNRDNVIYVAAANASKAKTLLCVSCMKSVLIPCHDKCVAKHKLNVSSKARRTFSVISGSPKSS
ncbi:hypothetical protein Tco_0800635 [Tanacetum coccineum]|uniref:Uncharacterized protein n=1 Tax=Tanacetum coccineum TaxID=301880 RepID=A0ABQ4ZX04_9ASTR